MTNFKTRLRREGLDEPPHKSRACRYRAVCGYALRSGSVLRPPARHAPYGTAVELYFARTSLFSVVDEFLLFSCFAYVGVVRTFLSYEAIERQRKGLRYGVWGTAVPTNNTRICVARQVLGNTCCTAENSAYCRTVCCGFFPAHAMSDFGKTNEMCCVIMHAECMHASLGRRNPASTNLQLGYRSCRDE